MKYNTRSFLGLAVLAGVSLVTPAFAGVNIGYVDVGNINNAADTTGYGAVAYNYKIARNETTISQYSEFLNAAAKSDPYALYSTNMASNTPTAGITRSGSSGNYSYAAVAGSENKPITFVSWFDAARFCNWMHNGQGAGSAEDGAYTLNGAMSGIYTKNANATVWIPSEDEWYKAAYYDATKGGYWLYPTQSDTMTTNDIGVAGAANYYDANGFATYVDGTSWGITDVGAYGENSKSAYGTNDQAGNIYEWNDAVVGSSRGVRGGNWNHSASAVASSGRGLTNPSTEYPYYNGFRVASVPEPSAMVLTMLAGGVLVTRRKR